MITSEKLYDISIIERLCRGDKEKIKKMVRVFIDQIPAAVEEIKSAYTNKDFKVIKKVAHRIKPILSYYAVVKIEKDIQLIEMMAGNEIVTVEMESKITKLDEAITSTVEKMKKDFA